jgi:aminoglycoside phosphotransferase (APT) family kinase protein
MPAPHGRDLELTRKRLVEWFEGVLPPGARDVRIESLSGPGTTGFSNDTLMFDLAWREGGEPRERALVVRIKPTGYQIFPDYDLARQFRIQARLAGTPVPVARMYWEEPDASPLGAPFYVMERVAGRIPTDNPPYHVGGWVTETLPEQRAALWWSGVEVLAQIHRLDWRARGLDFLDAGSRPGRHLERQLDDYARYLEWAARGKPMPLCEAGLAWLRANRPPPCEAPALCWGDARIGNMIFRDFRCVAVLDWEMAVIGDPEQDLGWWLFLDRHHSEGCGVPRLPGFPSRDETVARWESLTGRRVRRLDYFERFAAFRFSVIMIRLAQQMMEYGVLPPDSAFETDNIPSRLLARLLGLPAPGSPA